MDEFHKGLKQLYEELGKIKDGVEKSVQTSETLKPLKDKQDTITKEIGEIKESKYYKRHDEYAQNPTLIKAVTNALWDFADYVGEIFSKHTGKDSKNPEFSFNLSRNIMLSCEVTPMSQTKNDSKRETFFINYRS